MLQQKSIPIKGSVYNNNVRNSRTNGNRPIHLPFGNRILPYNAKSRRFFRVFSVQLHPSQIISSHPKRLREIDMMLRSHFVGHYL